MAESLHRSAMSKPKRVAIVLCESARPETSPYWLAAAMFTGAPEVARAPTGFRYNFHEILGGIRVGNISEVIFGADVFPFHRDIRRC